MKPSRYNHLIELDDGTVLAFNSASGALAEIEKENRAKITGDELHFSSGKQNYRMLYLVQE